MGFLYYKLKTSHQLSIPYLPIWDLLGSLLG